jgi:hypothetical protein
MVRRAKVMGLSEHPEIWEITGVVAEQQGKTRSQFIMDLVRVELERLGYTSLPDRPVRGRPKE